MIDLAHLPLTSGVYQIVCMRRAWRSYVGSSVNVRRRVQEHFRTLRLGRHKNHRLQEAFVEHGEQAFEVILIEACDVADLAVREQAQIDAGMLAHPAAGFNIAPHAYNGAQSEESRAKISAGLMGRELDEKARSNMRAAQLGKTQPESQRHKKREAMLKYWASLRPGDRVFTKPSPQTIAKRSASIRAAWARRRPSSEASQ